MMTTTLTEFLLARIAEDEAVANREAGVDRSGRWHPARVLVECEAKRRIVEVCGEMAGPYQVDHIINPTTIAATARAESILRLLALPYADHQDFDPAWAV